MKKNKIEVYFVNKFSWLGQGPMASVSTLFTYALAKEGVKTTLIAEGDPETEWEGLLRERFGLESISNFRVQLFKRTFFNKIKFTSGFYLRAYVHILRSRQRDRKTIVITRNTTFLTWLVALKWLHGCIVLFESHCYHGGRSLLGVPEQPKRKMFCMSNQFRVIERIFLNDCDGLICKATLQRELYVKDFVRVPTVVIPLGAQIHSDQASDRTEVHRPMKKRIACIGKYRAYLDQDILLDALVLCKGLGLSLLWIGLQESEQARFNKKARDRGVGGMCDLRGWMSHRSMIDLLRNEAGAGIVPYKPIMLTSALASPTKIFDYFAAGLPVIGPRIPTIAEHVQDRMEGALYKTGNARSLAKAIEAVFGSEKKYRKMKLRVAAAARRCSWSNRAETFLSFVDREFPS